MEYTICKEKHTVHCQGCYFLGDTQVLGHVRLKEMVQIKVHAEQEAKPSL